MSHQSASAAARSSGRRRSARTAKSTAISRRTCSKARGGWPNGGPSTHGRNRRQGHPRRRLPSGRRRPPPPPVAGRRVDARRDRYLLSGRWGRWGWAPTSPATACRPTCRRPTDRRCRSTRSCATAAGPAPRRWPTTSTDQTLAWRIGTTPASATQRGGTGRPCVCAPFSLECAHRQSRPTSCHGQRRQRVGHQAGGEPGAGRHHEVLAALVQVGHRRGHRPGNRRRHRPQLLPLALSSAYSLRVSGGGSLMLLPAAGGAAPEVAAALGHEQQRLRRPAGCRESPCRAAAGSGARDAGGGAARRPPATIHAMVPCVQVERGHAAVRRLDRPAGRRSTARPSARRGAAGSCSSRDRASPAAPSSGWSSTARTGARLSGSNAAPPQLAPPTQPGSCTAPRLRGRREERAAIEAASGPRCARWRSSGVKSMRSSSVSPWRSNAGGFVGNGCVGERPLARRRRLRHRPLFDRPDRRAGPTVEDVGEALLAHLRHRLDAPAVDGDVHQHRRRRQVVVPHAVVHRLEVPARARRFARRARQATRRTGSRPGRWPP